LLLRVRCPFQQQSGGRNITRGKQTLGPRHQRGQFVAATVLPVEQRPTGAAAVTGAVAVTGAARSPAPQRLPLQPGGLADFPLSQVLRAA